MGQSTNGAGLSVAGTKCQKCEARMCDQRVIHHWPDCEDYDEKSNSLCSRVLRRVV